MNLFVLSHHPTGELHRTWKLGGLHFCARCLGLYPVLFLGLIAQFKLRVPLEWQHDLLFVLGLTVPGLWDWSRGVSDPASGGNWLRTLTGVGLGVALSRSLYIHFQRPLPIVLLAQLGLISLVAGAVLYRRFGQPRDG